MSTWKWDTPYYFLIRYEVPSQINLYLNSHPVLNPRTTEVCLKQYVNLDLAFLPSTCKAGAYLKLTSFHWALESMRGRSRNDV